MVCVLECEALKRIISLHVSKSCHFPLLFDVKFYSLGIVFALFAFLFKITFVLQWAQWRSK